MSEPLDDDPVVQLQQVLDQQQANPVGEITETDSNGNAEFDASIDQNAILGDTTAVVEWTLDERLETIFRSTLDEEIYLETNGQPGWVYRRRGDNPLPPKSLTVLEVMLQLPGFAPQIFAATRERLAQLDQQAAAWLQLGKKAALRGDERGALDASGGAYNELRVALAFRQQLDVAWDASLSADEATRDV